MVSFSSILPFPEKSRFNIGYLLIKIKVFPHFLLFCRSFILFWHRKPKFSCFLKPNTINSYYNFLLIELLRKVQLVFLLMIVCSLDLHWVFRVCNTKLLGWWRRTLTESEAEIRSASKLSSGKWFMRQSLIRDSLESSIFPCIWKQSDDRIHINMLFDLMDIFSRHNVRSSFT